MSVPNKQHVMFVFIWLSLVETRDIPIPSGHISALYCIVSVFNYVSEIGCSGSSSTGSHSGHMLCIFEILHLHVCSVCNFVFNLIYGIVFETCITFSGPC